jgi:tetratricopeptide (TPR) repeat protein
MEKSLYPCANCAKKHAPKRCPCYRASYCGPTCQKAHWGEHKGVCTVFLSRETKEQKSKHGTDSSESLEAQYNLARQYYTDQKMDKAEKTLRKYLDACNRFQLQTPPGRCKTGHVMSAHIFLAGIYGDNGSKDLAFVHYEESLTICRRFHPDNHQTIEYLNTQLRDLGNGRRSVDEIKRSIAKLSDDDDNRLGHLNEELCMAYERNGETDMAMATGKKALEHVRKSEDEGCAARVFIQLADLLCQKDRFDEALTFVEESLPILRRYTGDKSFSVGNALSTLGRIYEGQHKDDDALKVIKKGLRYTRRSAGDKHEVTLVVAEHLLRHYVRRHMFIEALEMLGKEEDFMRFAFSDNYDGALARLKALSGSRLTRG